MQSCYNIRMDETTVPEPVNLETTSAHRRQFYLQILLPMAAGALILLGLGVLAANGGGDRPAVWAHISTIFMAMMFGMGGLVSLALLALAIFGTNWLLVKIPPKSFQVQIYTVYFARQITMGADKAAQSIVALVSGWAGLGSIFTKKSKKKGK